VFRSVRNLPRLYDGTLASVPGVVSARVWSVSAEAEDAGDVLVDLDGEQPGALPLAIRVLPGRLSLRAPRPGPACR
jgi:diacylglycerol kinase family enzyme